MRFIEVIEDRGAVDQCFSAIEHQGGHPAQRVVRAEPVAFAEARERQVLEVHPVECQSDPDAADEGAVELSDELHGQQCGTGEP